MSLELVMKEKSEEKNESRRLNSRETCILWFGFKIGVIVGVLAMGFIISMVL